MNNGFPTVDPNGFTVYWRPLIVRPIPNGPECFVAAIAAFAETGEVACRRLVDRRRLRAMFGSASVTLGAVVDASLASLENHLRARVGRNATHGHTHFQDWTSPLQGVCLGDLSEAYVSKFGDVFPRAELLCSTFGGEFRSPYLAEGPGETPWSVPVVEIIKKLKPQLSNSLNAQLRLSSMAHTVTFTFFDTALAANVVLVSAHRMAVSWREAKAHLWNLSLLADAPDLLIKPSRLELFAGVREDDERTRGAIEELASEASRRSVKVSRVESAEDAARQIIAKAA